MATAAGEFDNTDSEMMFTDDIQQPLEEFVCSHSLPQPVSVTRGSFMSAGAMIARGDVLLLRTMAPTSVNLSFTDTDTGIRREMEVSPDIPYKFVALPPKEGICSDPDSTESGGSFRSRPVSMVTYPTVADLLFDCPTLFEANATYDDPYLPGFSVKPGDKFRFVKVVRDSDDRTERLQCQTESGELVCLSLKCRGNFTVLLDSNVYTLRELVELARVPRRLKLSPENQGLRVSDADDSGGSSNQYIPEIPLSFTGVITMSKPEEKIEASPFDSPETNWFIPLDANIHVRLFSATDYEEPVTSTKVKPEPLAAFVNEHKHKFPVHATLFAYTTPPQVISKSLRDTRDVIVHKSVHTRKLFVKDSTKDEFFAIDESVDISFVEIPQTLSSIFEMMALPLGCEVQVLADVMADFPEPFVLRYGDVLRVTKHESSSWKFKHSSTGEVPIIKCERIAKGRKPEKLKLPLDLDVNLVVLCDPSQLRVTKLADIVAGEEIIPQGFVSVLEGRGGSFSPLPCALQVLRVLTDNELVVSPLHNTTAISPRIKVCVKIPLRHQVLLGLRRKLEFPESYFIMPPKHNTVSAGIERVEERDYEELVQAGKVAEEYEDVEFSQGQGHRELDEDARSQASSTGRSRYSVNPTVIPRSGSSDSVVRKRRKDRVKRITQVFNPKNWRLSRATGGGGEATEHEDLPPPLPPVSGILTLSLQPSQATSNDYMGEIGEGSGGTLQFKSPPYTGSDAEDFEDCPYEDVSISPGHQTAARSRLLQSENAEHVAQAVCHRSHSNTDIKRVTHNVEGSTSHSEQLHARELLSTETECRQQHSPQKSGNQDHSRQRKGPKEKCDGHSRERRVETSAHTSEENKKEQLSPASESKPYEGVWNSSQSRSPEDDLEKAPLIRHTRTRSPDLSRAQEKRGRARSPDKVKESSDHHCRDRLEGEEPSAPERTRKAADTPERSRENQQRHNDSVRPEAAPSPPERPRRKTHSPNDTKESSDHGNRDRLEEEIPSTPEKKRKGEHTLERRSNKDQHRHKDSVSPEAPPTPERRRNRTRAPDDIKENSDHRHRDKLEEEIPSTPERTRRNQARQKKSVSPETPSAPERRRKTQSSEGIMESSDHQRRNRLEGDKSSTSEQTRKSPHTPERTRRNHDRHKHSISPEASSSPERHTKIHPRSDSDKSHHSHSGSDKSHGRHGTPSPSIESDSWHRESQSSSSSSGTLERRRRPRSPDNHSRNVRTLERRREIRSPAGQSRDTSTPERRRRGQLPDNHSAGVNSPEGDQHAKATDGHSRPERSEHSHTLDNHSRSERTPERRRRRHHPDSSAEVSHTPERPKHAQSSTLPAKSHLHQTELSSHESRSKGSSLPRRGEREDLVEEKTDCNNSHKESGDSHSPSHPVSSEKTVKTAAKRDNREKPALPPKPVVSPDHRKPGRVKLTQPVAPPRRRGVGSTEAEMYSEDAEDKAVLGRRRTP